MTVSYTHLLDRSLKAGFWQGVDVDHKLAEGDGIAFIPGYLQLLEIVLHLQGVQMAGFYKGVDEIGARQQLSLIQIYLQ